MILRLVDRDGRTGLRPGDGEVFLSSRACLGFGPHCRHALAPAPPCSKAANSTPILDDVGGQWIFTTQIRHNSSPMSKTLGFCPDRSH